MYSIGDKVVYPMHGAGVIEGIEDKEILGEVKSYYILSLPIKNMRVMLPVDNIEGLGLRDVIDSSEVDSVLQILSQEQTEMNSNWNRRYRDNMELVKTGDVIEVACVVRNLMILDREKGLSTGERKMLANTKQILVSELILARGLDELEVERLIKDSIIVS